MIFDVLRPLGVAIIGDAVLGSVHCTRFVERWAFARRFDFFQHCSSKSVGVEYNVQEEARVLVGEQVSDFLT